MWWQTGSKIRSKNIPWMIRAKEYVIVVLAKFKELVEVNKLKWEAKNRYENHINSSLSNIKLNPKNSGPLASQTWAVILIELHPFEHWQLHYIWWPPKSRKFQLLFRRPDDYLWEFLWTFNTSPINLSHWR